MKFFNDCQTLDELKKAYRIAAMKHHPDRGGDTATMQAINSEYEVRFEQLKHQHNARAAEDTSGKTRATSENAGDFILIVNELLKLDGIEVELCGRWLWISGDTKPHKDRLKAIGCRWCSKKKLWSWHFEGDGEAFSRGKRTMEQIRNKYGSTRFEKGNYYEVLNG